MFGFMEHLTDAFLRIAGWCDRHQTITLLLLGAYAGLLVKAIL